MIVLTATMQKAGSLWFLNMVNDLLIAAGHQNYDVVRRKYRLDWFIRESGHMPVLRLHKALQLLVPHFLGNTFVINTHSAPSPSARSLIYLGIIRPIYVYRDPRDVARSLFEHGEELRRWGGKSSTSYDRLMTIEDGIRFTQQLLPIWDAWMKVPGVLTTTYEALRANTIAEISKVNSFLKLGLPMETIEQVVKRYAAETSSEVKMHLNKGIIGRWKEMMTEEQIELCRDLYGDYINRMGYEE